MVCKPNLVATVFPIAPPAPAVIGANKPETAPVEASFFASFNVYFLPPLTASAYFTPVFTKAPVPAAKATPNAILPPPVNGAAAIERV